MRKTQHCRARYLWAAALVGLALSFTGCSMGGSSNSSDTVAVGDVVVQPSNAEIRASGTVQFSADVNGMKDQSVAWSVNDIAGGDSTIGTVDANGLYRAPILVPTPNSVQVQATSAANKKVSAASAVTVDNPLPVILSLLPTQIPIGLFTISITGKNFVNGAVVVFGSQFLPTTFNSSTSLTATGNQTSPVPGGVQVTVLNPDPGSGASNAFMLQVGTSNGVSADAAARFLEQATWGPTPQAIAHVQQVGLQTFLYEQSVAAKSYYLAPPQDADITFVQQRFFVNALNGNDQLRQRVAFALSQIMVVSALKVNDPNAFVLWQNMMQNDALGNFSTLLNDVTTSPVMGNYLDMVNNDKPNPGNGTTPNENYAREAMQLFSIGLAQLNLDGTPQLDGAGNTIPTYDQDTIEGFAHVYTGWTYPPMPGSSPQFFSPPYFSGPMIPIDSHHDTGTKVLLNGTVLPAGGTAQADLTAAMQNIFNHPNMGPFISRQLIQHLVTSNPSPAYVARIATVFNDNGQGVRGDLQAVVNAILLDGEARRGDDPTQAQANDGHLKEPILYMTHLLRSVNAVSDATTLADYAAAMKESPMLPPTVFNFFPPNYVIQGTTLEGPEFQILNTSTVISRINFVNDLIYGSVGSGTTTEISGYVGLAANPDQMLDAMSTVMLHGNMSSDMRSTLITTISAIPDNTRRAKAALYLIGSSSQFQIEH